MLLLPSKVTKQYGDVASEGGALRIAAVANRHPSDMLRKAGSAGTVSLPADLPLLKKPVLSAEGAESNTKGIEEALLASAPEVTANLNLWAARQSKPEKW